MTCFNIKCTDGKELICNQIFIEDKRSIEVEQVFNNTSLLTEETLRFKESEWSYANPMAMTSSFN